MHYLYLEKLTFQLVLEIVNDTNDDKNSQGYLAR